jgi:hypothetical protein
MASEIIFWKELNDVGRLTPLASHCFHRGYDACGNESLQIGLSDAETWVSSTRT